MEHTLLAALTGVGFALAGMLGVFRIAISTTLRGASVAVAAGILLAVTFADLLPEAFESTSHSSAAFGFAAGFLALFLIEATTRAHLHHHDPADGHDHTHDDLGAHHAVLPFLTGLALHNLTDGIAIGTGSELSSSAALAVTTGVLVHQLPVGISFGAVLASMGMSGRSIVRNSLLLGALIPIGAVLVALAGTFESRDLGVLVAASGGALAYVATGHLLPEVQSEQRQGLVTALFAATLLVTTGLFTQLAGH